MTLPDPRLQPLEAPKNPLIRQAVAVTTEPNAASSASLYQSLTAQMADALLMGDNQSLAVALQLAPNQSAYKALWHALNDILAQPSAQGFAHIFAFPIVMVVGAKGEAQLPVALGETGSFISMLQDQGLIAADAQCAVLPHLVHPESLASLSLSELYQLSQRTTSVEQGLPVKLLPAPIEFKDEGVFVRYLVGVAMQPAHTEPVIKLGGSMGEWGMVAMKWLGDTLKTEGVTLFPIPLVPNVVPEALRQGAAMRLEVNLQVVASNTIRRLREKNLPVVAIASSHEGGEIRFTFSTPGETKNMAAFVWPLAPLDALPRIEENFQMLMKECQVDDVRLIAGLQPNEVNDIPFFVTACDIEAQSSAQH